MVGVRQEKLMMYQSLLVAWSRHPQGPGVGHRPDDRKGGAKADLSMSMGLGFGGQGVGLHSSLHLGLCVSMGLSLQVVGMHCHLLCLLCLALPCTPCTPSQSHTCFHSSVKVPAC